MPPATWSTRIWVCPRLSADVEVGRRHAEADAATWADVPTQGLVIHKLSLYDGSGRCVGRPREKWPCLATKGGDMSKEAAQELVEKMKSDEAFRARVMAEEDVEARMALIGAEGFDCSAEEIGALQELGDAELDAVAGGGAWLPDLCGLGIGDRCGG